MLLSLSIPLALTLSLLILLATIRAHCDIPREYLSSLFLTFGPSHDGCFEMEQINFSHRGIHKIRHYRWGQLVSLAIRKQTYRSYVNTCTFSLPLISPLTPPILLYPFNSLCDYHSRENTRFNIFISLYTLIQSAGSKKDLSRMLTYTVDFPRALAAGKITETRLSLYMSVCVWVCVWGEGVSE